MRKSLGALALCIVAPVAMAQGLYLKGGVGYGFIHDDYNPYFNTKWTDEFTTHFAVDAAVGYDFNRYFAIEGSYQHYFDGSTTAYTDTYYYNGHATTTYYGSESTSANNVVLFGVLKAPVSQKVTLFAKAGPGFTWWNNASEGWRTNYATIGFGAGAEYAITEKVGVSLEYLGNTNSIHRVDTQAVMANVVWRFK